MRNTPTSQDGFIDSRDIEARICELEDEETACETPEAIASWVNSEEGEELVSLRALKEDAEGYCDWDGGATLIREDYFVEYCKELIRDIGDLPKYIPDYIEIDWDVTAENLKVDYTETSFDGVTYLVR
jgi:hypothetical protein